MPYFAHSGTPGNHSDWQGLPVHLNETAELAAKFAAPFGLDRLAFVTALLHDLGKYDPRFQERLAGKDIRVDHSTAGAVVLRDLAKGLDRFSRLMAEMGAYAGADRNRRSIGAPILQSLAFSIVPNGRKRLKSARRRSIAG